MSPDDRNLAQLARDTASDLAAVASKEVRLATVEMQQNLAQAGKGFSEAALGAALMIPAATVALIGVAFALATIDGLADWAALIIVAVVAAIAGAIMMKAGKNALDLTRLAPRKTFENLRRDANALKDAAQ